MKPGLPSGLGKPLRKRGAQGERVGATAALGALLLGLGGVLVSAALPGPAAPSDDRAGLVTLPGGRRIYLECRGTGQPTVVLVAGLRGSADEWTHNQPPGQAPRPTVFAGVARFSRVCAYDRPGTPVGESPSRSDPVPQPTTAADAAADLQGLLRASGEARPYVLVGHSYGGLVVRLLASTHPGEISGLVLVDALSEGLQDAETPQQWAIQRRLLEGEIRDSVRAYPALERIDPDRSFDQMRAAPPLAAVPLIVLSADRPWGPQIPAMIQAGVLPKDIPADFGYVTDAAQHQAQDRLAQLVPQATHIRRTQSGHDIHKEQPLLVIQAIRTVVEAVRGGNGQRSR